MNATDWPPQQARVLQELLEQRCSCRAFSPCEVRRDRIEMMFAMAQRSASWCNTQPWQIIATSGAGTERFRRGLSEHARHFIPKPDFPGPERYTGAYLERRREVGWQLYDAVGVRRGDRVGSAAQAHRNFELFGAPHVAIVTTESDLGVYGAVDSGVYLGNLMLAAHSLGLGTVAQAAIAMHSDYVREHFGIPDYRRILVGVSFGYPDIKHPANLFRSSRADIHDVVEWVDH